MEIIVLGLVSAFGFIVGAGVGEALNAGFFLPGFVGLLIVWIIWVIACGGCDDCNSDAGWENWNDD